MLPTFEIPNLTKNCNEALILAILFKEKKHGYQLALEIEEKRELVRLLVEKLQVYKDHVVMKIVFLDEQSLPLP